MNSYNNKKYEEIEPNRFEQIDIDTYYNLFLMRD